MDGAMTKVGTYMFTRKAGKELSSVTNEINSLSAGLEGGAKWLANKVKGKMQKPLTEVLKEFDLPQGLFPLDTSSYEFNETTKKLTVHIPTICEVRFKDSSFVRYSTIVTGDLETGKMSNVEGVKTKISYIWPKVSFVMTEGTQVHFMTTIKRTTRERKAYEALRDCITVDKF